MLMGVHTKVSGETTPSIWVSVKGRTRVYKIITSYHVSAYLGKKCVWGKYVLFAQKVGMLSLYLKK